MLALHICGHLTCCIIPCTVTRLCIRAQYDAQADTVSQMHLVGFLYRCLAITQSSLHPACNNCFERSAKAEQRK